MSHTAAIVLTKVIGIGLTEATLKAGRIPDADRLVAAYEDGDRDLLTAILAQEKLAAASSPEMPQESHPAFPAYDGSGGFEPSYPEL